MKNMEINVLLHKILPPLGMKVQNIKNAIKSNMK